MLLSVIGYQRACGCNSCHKSNAIATCLHARTCARRPLNVGKNPEPVGTGRLSQPDHPRPPRCTDCPVGPWPSSSPGRSTKDKKKKDSRGAQRRKRVAPQARGRPAAATPLGVNSPSLHLGCPPEQPYPTGATNLRKALSRHSRLFVLEHVLHLLELIIHLGVRRECLWRRRGGPADHALQGR